MRMRISVLFNALTSSSFEGWGAVEVGGGGVFLWLLFQTASSQRFQNFGRFS